MNTYPSSGCFRLPAHPFARFVTPPLAALLLILAPEISQGQTLVTTNGIWITGTAAGDGGGAGTGASIAFGNADQVFVGRTGNGVAGVAVFAFQLPTLALGESIGSASFTIKNLTTNTTLTTNIDLYGLNYRATSAITTADYFVGSLDTTGATLLKENWFASGSFPSINTFFTTDAGASAALANYLNDQYAAGAVGGNYVFLRLNTDAFNDVSRIVVAGAVTGANNPSSDNFPYITYTIVPEPGTAAMLSGGLMFLLFKRRRSEA